MGLYFQKLALPRLGLSSLSHRGLERFDRNLFLRFHDGAIAINQNILAMAIDHELCFVMAAPFSFSSEKAPLL
jgi:hypothetical protein